MFLQKSLQMLSIDLFIEIGKLTNSTIICCCCFTMIGKSREFPMRTLVWTRNSIKNDKKWFYFEMKFIILVNCFKFPEICPKFGLQINILTVILGSVKFTAR